MNNPDALNSKKSSGPLQTNLTEAAAACKEYRSYIASNYKEGFADGYTSYLLNREDLDALLQDGTLDGVRIYIGHEDKGNGPLVRLFAVGCMLAPDGMYQDVITEKPAAESKAQPASLLSTTATAMSIETDQPAMAQLTSGRPCPSECGGKSILNS